MKKTLAEQMGGLPTPKVGGCGNCLYSQYSRGETGDLGQDGTGLALSERLWPIQ